MRMLLRDVCFQEIQANTPNSSVKKGVAKQMQMDGQMDGQRGLVGIISDELMDLPQHPTLNP